MAHTQNHKPVFEELDRLTQHLIQLGQRQGRPIPPPTPLPPLQPAIPGRVDPPPPPPPRPQQPQLALPPRATDPKSYPIVLVPGFLGWCTPFLGHYNYFGGFVNIAAILASQGWAVICPQIGPVSSNFERACEIYAQLTHGSCDGLAYDVPIDYGVPIHGTAVYYHPNPPLRKQAISFNLPKGWKWGADTPVHFVAHSQGGNTCRYLIHLLERGWCAEQSRYFTERKMGWVKSLTTLASPLNGSGIIDVLEDMGTAEDVLLDKIILAASYTRQDQRGFDFCLDHRGLCPPDQLPLLDGETAPDDLLQYMNYMSRPEGALAKWRESTYNGFYDNSIVGVVGDLNKIIGPPSQDVYYFTLSFVATVTVPELKLELDDVFKLPRKVEVIWDGVRDVWKKGKEVARVNLPSSSAADPTSSSPPSSSSSGVSGAVGGVVGRMFSLRKSSGSSTYSSSIGPEGASTSASTSSYSSTAQILTQKAKKHAQKLHTPSTHNNKLITERSQGSLLLTLLKHIFGPASTLQSIAIWAIDRINSRRPPQPSSSSPQDPNFPNPHHHHPHHQNQNPNHSTTTPKLPLPSSTLPRYDLFPAFLVTAYGMCSFTLSPTQKEVILAAGGIIDDREWRSHDGVVPTVSMSGPWGPGNIIISVDEFLDKVEHTRDTYGAGSIGVAGVEVGSSSGVMGGVGVTGEGKVERGVWYDLGRCEWMDHADCIGSCVNPMTIQEVVGLFGRIGRLLEVLPTELSEGGA